MEGRPYMMRKRSNRVFALVLAILMIAPAVSLAQMDLLELYCPSCGYRERFMQGSDQWEEQRNVQNIIVVCERSGQIRNIKIPIDPGSPVHGEPCWPDNMEWVNRNCSAQNFPASLSLETHARCSPLPPTLKETFARLMEASAYKWPSSWAVNSCVTGFMSE